MNIAVCVKQIPDPNLPQELAGDRLKREGVANVLDPGDEYGVEAALQLAEKHGGEVTVVSMGPASAMEAVRKALSMGAHKGVLISDDALAGADALLTARVLAAAIGRGSYDLVLCAVESTDGYTGTVAGTIAALLDVPQCTFAKSLEVADGTLTMRRQTAKGYDVVQCPLPALATVTAGANEPRYPSFKGIVAAKSKPVDQLSLSDLDLGGDARATQSIASVTDAPQREAGEVVEDDGTGAEKIAAYLEKVKVI